MRIFSLAIVSAKHSVLLVNYALTDPCIIETLRQKAHQGIDIRVICDIKGSPQIDDKLGSEIMTTRRIGLGLMHQKILVIDNEMTWLGSANMTTDSLCSHGNLVAGVRDTVLAKAISDKAKTLHAEGKNERIPHQSFLIGGQEIELWFLPDDRGAVARINRTDPNGQKNRAYCYVYLDTSRSGYGVDRGHKTGCKTEVVIDHNSGKAASAKIVKLLKKNRGQCDSWP